MTWCSPLPTHRITMPDEPGTFGFVRKHHIHEGVDLYCPEGTRVAPVESGLVVSVIPFTGEHADPPSPWWNETQAVLVEGPSGVVVYGEIIAHVMAGQPVNTRTVIGRVRTVLKKDKGRPMSMLHLELHERGTRNAFDWFIDQPRPPSLLDPTPHLIEMIADLDRKRMLDMWERHDRAIDFDA